MNKLKMQRVMNEIESNLEKTYFHHGKKLKSVVTALPHKVLRKFARQRVYREDGYVPGTLGASHVFSVTSRRERREGTEFVPRYNGPRYKTVWKFNKDKNTYVSSLKEIKE